MLQTIRHLLIRPRCFQPEREWLGGVRTRLAGTPWQGTQLNPVERLWLYLKENRLSYCVFHTIEQIIDACCDAWNWLFAETGRIRSLCSYPWLKQVKV